MNQWKRGFSPLILFVGQQRMGKTALALKIAYELNKDFDMLKHMFYRIEDFAQAYDKYDNCVFIIDEAGISLDPYEHASITQRVYNHIIQSQAYKKNIVFLVLPFASEIGKAHRKHVNAIVHIVGRGVYTLYASRSWHPDLSHKPPRLMKIETISHVPLPPSHIWIKYTEDGQSEYKKGIMDLQQDLLKMKSGKAHQKRQVFRGALV